MTPRLLILSDPTLAGGVSESESMTRAPLVLLASDDEWTARSLTSVLAPRGYAVLRAYTAEQALERAAASDPDALFITDGLPDMESGTLCRRLLEGESISRAAPIIVLVPAHTSRQDKLDAMAAGAWEVVQLPLDPDELLLRLDRFTQGKLELDRHRGDALVDHVTGLYNREGILQRVREVGATAERFGRPLACIVLAADDGSEGSPAIPAEELVDLAGRLRRITRQSDVLARIGARDFAVIAPDTPLQGATILAHRLREQAEEPQEPGGRRIRAGVYAVADPSAVKLDPAELLQRATSAMQASRPD